MNVRTATGHIDGARQFVASHTLCAIKYLFLSIIFTASLAFFEYRQMALADDMKSSFVRQSPESDTVIVFVHGFTGDGVSTWSSSNAYWPRLLIEDKTFDGTDVFVYSYPTGFWSTMSIDELAENMRSVLSVNHVTAYHRIVFLSHSMGGLITRAYLLKNRDIAGRTSFAYFFSTPTTGSQVASIVSVALSSPQISKLKAMKSDDYLADMLRQWLSAGFEFPSYCAYEKRLTSGLSLVVDMASASALCTKALDPIDADHIQIVKPQSQDSAAYIAFKAAYADAIVQELKKQLDSKKFEQLRSEIK